MNPLTDLELINQCLSGDQDAFAQLIERYKNLVYSIILRKTKDSEEANDLAQDVFLKLYKNLRAYSPEYKFATWVIRITTNHIIDQHRRKKQETLPLEEHAYDLPATEVSGSPEAAYLKNEQTKRINKIVAGLPAMYRVPIILYHQQGLSYQEIAEIIDEPLSKVKNRIFRGRKLLRESMLEERL